MLIFVNRAIEKTDIDANFYGKQKLKLGDEARGFVNMLFKKSHYRKNVLFGVH